MYHFQTISAILIGKLLYSLIKMRLKQLPLPGRLSSLVKTLLWLLISVSVQNLDAQVLVNGFILDKKTGEPLSAANIQITNTFRGTITNEDGKFQIELLQLPSILTISYIGYETQQVSLADQPEKVIYIYLKPVILESEPIVVIAEDPAIGIMREVIRCKIAWREALKTYHAHAYSRLVFENDSGIVSIAESISETYWDCTKGPREVIKSKKQTSNLSEEQNIAFASYIPNFYDDDIDEIGYKVIGPTHPDALDYYDFKLTKIRLIDDHKVFTILAIPSTKLQPTFEGTLEILDSVYALLAVDLKPSAAVLYPPPIQEWNLHYRQQFHNFGKVYWLPIDFRAEGSIKIGIPGLSFPTIYYKRITGLTDYQINAVLPDSLYKKEDFLSVDSIAIQDNAQFANRKEIIPLIKREEEAYQTLDSTMTLRKAFKPKGFLAKIVDVQVEGDREKDGKKGTNFFSYFNPQVWFNRVDGLHAGIKYTPSLGDRMHLMLQAAYKTGLSKGAYGAEIEYRHTTTSPLHFKFILSTTTDVRMNSDTYSRTIASIAPLLAAEDYFDYYWNKSYLFESGVSLKKLNSVIITRFKSEIHTSVNKQTDYNLVGSNFKQRPNPAVDPGTLHAIELQIRYGDTFVPFGVVGQNRVEITIEHSSPHLFSSHFDYTRYQLGVDLRLNTFLKRRLLPMALDLHLVGGTSHGNLPLQKFFGIDSDLLILSPFSVLRSLSSRPLEGEKYAAVFFEHNFRTVLFEILGLDYLARKSYGIILHGAFGRTWISAARLNQLREIIHYTDHVHQEIGLSLNGVFSLFRIDFTQRLDKKVTFLGIGFTRFF